MSLAAEIVGAWRHGWGNALHRQIARGAGEERALGWLMVAIVLLVVAQLPVSYRTALASLENPEEAPIAVLMTAIFSLFLAPLTFYALAGLSHFPARALGATGPFLNARLGLFWALLCVAPVALIAAALGNYLGPDMARSLQFIVLLVFFIIWVDTMAVAESLRSRWRAGLALLAIGVSFALLVGMLPRG